jgi:predicted alpha/beta superfamily hydrolase
MITIRKTVLLCLCSIFSFQVLASNLDSATSFALPHTHKVAMKSPSGISYELVITLPASYKDSADKRYPVLYYTDAQWDAPLLNSIYSDLEFDRAIPEMVMVGITYSGEKPNYTLLRTKDYTPTKDKSFERDSGGGPAFLKFIKESIIPKVETEYRIDSSQRAIAGWSFGGLFALYAMYSEPQLFKRCIAVSPATQWHKGYINQLDDEFFKSNNKLNARLFISYAQKENAEFAASVAALQRKLENRKTPQLQLMNYSVENMRHAGAKAAAYAQGLAWVWADIKL